MKTNIEPKNQISPIDEEKRDFQTTAGLAIAGGAAKQLSH